MHADQIVVLQKYSFLQAQAPKVDDVTKLPGTPATPTAPTTPTTPTNAANSTKTRETEPLDEEWPLRATKDADSVKHLSKALTNPY